VEKAAWNAGLRIDAQTLPAGSTAGAGRRDDFRAGAARAWLVETGGIEGGRLSLQSQPFEGPTTGVQVELSSP